MTGLPSAADGQGSFLFRILDFYSRKFVGFAVWATDYCDHAAHLLRRTAFAGGLHGRRYKLVFRGQNGATLNATTGLFMLH